VGERIAGATGGAECEASGVGVVKKRTVEIADMSTVDANRVILTGENSVIRLSNNDSDTFTTNATFWRVLSCAGGPGHVLYLKSELTEARWRIYSDNIAMVRWLQSTVLGAINSELLDLTIAVTDTQFSHSGNAVMRVTSGQNVWTPA
jgi:hypothetical protein